MFDREDAGREDILRPSELIGLDWIACFDPRKFIFGILAYLPLFILTAISLSSILPVPVTSSMQSIALLSVTVR